MIQSSIKSMIKYPLTMPVYLPGFLLFAARNVLVPVLPLYAATMVDSYALVGLVLASESIGKLICDLPAGMIITRLGQKKAMQIGIVISILATLGLFWAGSVYAVIGLCLFSGAGGALFGVARHAYLADAIPTESRGKANAMLGGIFRVGWFIGPAVGGLVAASFGLRYAFLVHGSVSLIALVILSVNMQELKNPQMIKSQAASLNGLVRFGKMLRTHFRTLLTAGSAQVTLMMVRLGRSTIIPLYAADVLAMNVQSIGLIISLMSAVDMLLFFPAGWLMDRLGRKFAIIPSVIILALGIGLIPLTHNPVSFGVAVMLIGLGNGLGSGAMLTLGADLAPPQSRSEFLGAWQLIGDLGGLGNPLVIGWVAEIFALPMAAFTLAGIGAVSALIFLLIVPETRQRSSKINTPREPAKAVTMRDG